MTKEWPVTTDWLRARAEVSPQTTAVVIEDLTFTFHELDRLVDKLCGYMKSKGAQPKEHLGLLMNNSLATVCCVYASARLGATLVPFNTRLTTGELSWQIGRSDCHRLICLRSTAAVGLEAVAGQLPVETFPDEADSFATWLDVHGQNFEPDGPPADFNSIQAIVFTSGTTGFPKGAMITYANHFWSATGSAFRLGVKPDDRWLACLPLYHVGGLAIQFRSCLYGTAIVLHQGFDVQKVLNALRNDGITIVSLVPTMLSRLLEAGLTIDQVPDLRLILLGGAAASPQLIEEAERVGLSIAASYGLTEACSQVATLLPEGSRQKPGSAGKPLLFTQIKILGDEDQILGPNSPGEVGVAGPTIMAGYYAEPDASAKVLRDGLLHTGDIGFLDEDGDLWILDRRSDLIVSGGENIYPAEVERVLLSHPAIAAACVVGLPHPDWGQQVSAMLVQKPGYSITEDDLSAFARERLAAYKCPRNIIFTDKLPLTGSGKIQRSEVAKQLGAIPELA